MVQKLTRQAHANPYRPKMALGLDTLDRDHLPHHLTRSEVGESSCAVSFTFSAGGGWVEMRVEESFTRYGSARGQRKVISTVYKEEALQALLAFAEQVKAQMEAKA
jgi:hypothetical protein